MKINKIVYYFKICSIFAHHNKSSQRMKIQIINGPNLNLPGVREPGIYGSDSFETYLPQLRAEYPDVEIEYYQSNIEGELINKMQVGFTFDGICSMRALRTPACTARLHPFAEMPNDRGAYLQRPQARRVPPPLHDQLRLHGRDMDLDWTRTDWQ